MFFFVSVVLFMITLMPTASWKCLMEDLKKHSIHGPQTLNPRNLWNQQHQDFMRLMKSTTSMVCLNQWYVIDQLPSLIALESIIVVMSWYTHKFCTWPLHWNTCGTPCDCVMGSFWILFGKINMFWAMKFYWKIDSLSILQDAKS